MQVCYNFEMLYVETLNYLVVDDDDNDDDGISIS